MPNKLTQLNERLYKEFPVKNDLRHGIILNKSGLVLWLQVGKAETEQKSFSFQESELNDIDKFITDIKTLMRQTKSLDIQKRITNEMGKT